MRSRSLFRRICEPLVELPFGPLDKLKMSFRAAQAQDNTQGSWGTSISSVRRSRQAGFEPPTSPVPWGRFRRGDTCRRKRVVEPGGQTEELGSNRSRCLDHRWPEACAVVVVMSQRQILGWIRNGGERSTTRCRTYLSCRCSLAPWYAPHPPQNDASLGFPWNPQEEQVQGALPICWTSATLGQVG